MRQSKEFTDHKRTITPALWSLQKLPALLFCMCVCFQVVTVEKVSAEGSDTTSRADSLYFDSLFLPEDDFMYSDFEDVSSSDEIGFGGFVRPLSEISFGTSYDYISQTFYVLDTASDQLDASSRLNEEYLNQPGLFADFRLNPLRDDKFMLRSFLERSEDFVRGRFELYLRPKSSRNGLSVDLSADGRGFTGDSVTLGDEYFSGRSKLKYTQPLNEMISAFVVGRGEYQNQNDVTGFESSSFAADYHKLGGELGLDFELGGFNQMIFSGGYERREAPEQATLNYNRTHFNLNYNGFALLSYYTIEFFYDNRNYDTEGDSNDQRWMRFFATGKFDLANHWAIEPELSVEAFDFRVDSSSVNSDQTLIQVETRFIRSWRTTSAGFGVRLAGLSQTEPTSAASNSSLFPELESFSEEYTEAGLVGEFEYFRAGSLILTVENVFGFRDMASESDYQSDHWFDRFSAFGSWEFAERFKLSLIGSVETERHDQNSDDTSFYMLNSSLSYTL